MGLLDSISPTPRNGLLGLLADALMGADRYANKPQAGMPMGKANPVLGLLSDAIGLGGAGRTLDRLSYGDPITNIGKANVPLIPQGTADAAMLGAGLLQPVSRGALKASDAAVRAISRNPQATAAGVVDYAADMVPSSIMSASKPVPLGFNPDGGLVKRVMSDAKAETTFNAMRDQRASALFGHQGVSSYDQLTAKQRAVVDVGLPRGANELAFKTVPEQKQINTYLKDILGKYPELSSNVHKNADLTFQSMPISDFNGPLIYKSPSYNGRQSSEYRMVLIDGEPAYARKSDHFGKFFTNVLEGSDEAKLLGLTNEGSDPFGRVGSKAHNWEIVGGNGKGSQAGYIKLSDLINGGLLGK